MPNLFNFATSELSQDAFLAWIANWADDRNADKDQALNDVARQFLVKLSGEAFESSDIRLIETRQQFAKIDVIIEVTLRDSNKDKHLIVIEDKTSAGQHGNQLKTYKAAIEKEVSNGPNYQNHVPHYVYYKTHDHITRDLHGFRNFSRVNALEIFESLKAQTIYNNIFRDYVSHLRKMEDASNGYADTPTEKWKDDQWRGFLKALCEELDDGANFGYIPNASGGFIGAWFGGAKLPEMNNGDELYLQLGSNKNTYPYFDLKVRVASATKERTEQLKADVSKAIMRKLDKADIPFNTKNIRSGKSVAIINIEDLQISETCEKVENFTSDIKRIIAAIRS